MRTLTFLFTCCLGLAAAPSLSHEFWIAPEQYQVDARAVIRADLRVGQDFTGSTMIFNPDEFARFDLIRDGAATPASGRLGDLPALTHAAGAPGLVVVVHETQDRVVTYKDWEQFRHFVEEKDLGPALESHRQRGLPDAGFGESYRRFAKSLVAVGDGAGADRRVGLNIEIVAEANPYTDRLEGGMPLRVFLDGAPRADAQLELFERDAEGAVTLTLHRTDAEGRVTVPVTPGAAYLANSAVLRTLDNDAADAGPVWHTDWASLTFAVPDASP
ncbi:DUF4198 domain-containing protein [Tropicimonas aquimaris]|uniref:DUF4198 domain-containing protein n=1 Tax=Tropicimonas aquimaris TaxID=914152 RepID=A0ABW3IKX6_9RHOB